MGDNWRKAPMGIFWDWENANIGEWTNTIQVVGNVCKAVDEIGIKGDLSLMAYGHWDGSLSYENRCELQAMGPEVFHVVTKEGKNSSDGVIKQAIYQWKKVNKQPANILLLSGDTGFWKVLKKLKKSGDNILIASRHIKRDGQIPDKINEIADVIRNWQELCAGDGPLINKLV